MPRFLVLANQTASSPELTTAVREIIKKDAGYGVCPAGSRHACGRSAGLAGWR